MKEQKTDGDEIRSKQSLELQRDKVVEDFRACKVDQAEEGSEAERGGDCIQGDCGPSIHAAQFRPVRKTSVSGKGPDHSGRGGQRSNTCAKCEYGHKCEHEDRCSRRPRCLSQDRNNGELFVRYGVNVHVAEK